MATYHHKDIKKSISKLAIKLSLCVLLGVFVNAALIVPYLGIYDQVISLVEPMEEEEQGNEKNEVELEDKVLICYDQETKFIDPRLIRLNLNLADLQENYSEVFTPPPELS